MRMFESLVLLAVVGGVAWHMGGPEPRRGGRETALIVLAAVVLQVLLEPFRWQLVPVLAVAGALGVAAWRGHRPGRRARRVWSSAVVIAMLLPVALPVPRLPEPGGSYAVGTTTLLLVDDSRVEAYGPQPGGPRRLPLHVWYPASETDAEPEPWMSTAVAAQVAEAYGLPGFALDHLGLVDTHAVRDAPFVGGEESFPVVIYSHGWGGFGWISPDQPERLASHGYVVLAPDHTYGALAAWFADGFVGIDEDALPDEEDVGEAVFDEAAETLVGTFADDVRFVIDTITTGELAGLGMGRRIDVDRIGLYGHSTGGGAAVAVCLSDPRCDAVLGLDPWVIPVGPGVAAGLTQPFLALRSDLWVGEENDEVLFALHGAGNAPSAILALEGANHYDFVALSQISPLTRYLGFTGSIPAPLAREVIGRSMVAFFGTHLRADPVPLPDVREVRVDAIRR